MTTVIIEVWTSPLLHHKKKALAGAKLDRHLEHGGHGFLSPKRIRYWVDFSDLLGFLGHLLPQTEMDCPEAAELP